MLSDALKTLSAPPSAGERKQALADVNAKITTLELQLGIKARLMPILNAPRAAARLAELQGQLAAKNSTATPAAAASPPDSRPVELTGDATTDKAIAASGCHSRRHYSAKAKRDKLFATAANLPPGSTSRACAESNLAKAQEELANA